MKTLETKFVKNCDKHGDTTFVQLRREGNVCLYRRFDMNGNPLECEVFAVKTILEGASLPGGGTVLETYESYPGKSAFGKSAWSCCGLNCEKRANQRFDELVKGKIKPVVEVEAEVEMEETESVPVIRVRGRKASVIKELKIPAGEFSQKELASFNGYDNYKVVYTDLHKMLNRGILKLGSKRDSVKGKKAQLFVRA